MSESPDGRAAMDWEAIEASPDFQELIAEKRRYVTPRVIFFLAWYVAFIILAGYAPGFMGESVYEGLTVGYVFALTQFVMVWYLAWSYVRKADRDFDPLEEQVVANAQAGQAPEPTGRRERTAAGETVRS